MRCIHKFLLPYGGVLCHTTLTVKPPKTTVNPAHMCITVGNSSQGVNCFNSIQLTYMGVVCVIIEGMRFFLVFFG